MTSRIPWLPAEKAFRRPICRRPQLLLELLEQRALLSAASVSLPAAPGRYDADLNSLPVVEPAPFVGIAEERTQGILEVEPPAVHFENHRVPRAPAGETFGDVTEGALAIPGRFDGDLRELPTVDPAPIIGVGDERTQGIIEVDPPPVPAPAESEDAKSDNEVQAPAGVAVTSAAFANATPNFNGIVFTGITPPDAIGDVGPNHYIQMVNSQFQVFDKQGNSLAGPFFINQPWINAGVGNLCQNNNNGDPYVVYDHLADRWLISQFAIPNGFQNAPLAQCIAISQTADPVTGGWFLYEFVLDEDNNNNGVLDPGEDVNGNGNLDSTVTAHDYPKIGLWPDGYYMSSQQGFSGGQLNAVVFDRLNMLMGNPATFQSATSPSPALIWLPSDLDGPAPPLGTPNFFSRHVDGNLWGGVDRVDVMAFSVDWATPANSSFAALPSLATAAFDSGFSNPGNLFDTSIPQPSAAIPNLDVIPNWSMGPLQYRNFGTHETLVFNHTVDVDGLAHAGVRWYELRRPPGGAWTIFQQGVYSPDGGNPGLADDPHRWMGSAAMDKAGNIAIGYSASSATLNPSINYAGRLASDPPGLLPRGEFTLVAGTGPVVIFDSMMNPLTRLGDYSGMRVDPVDDCTFWFTGEYGLANFAWATRVGAFRFPSCDVVPDGFEPNDTIEAATVLGSLPKITLRDLSIHDEEDVDYLKYTAQDTGKTIVNALFDHDAGDLNLRVLDMDGNVITSSATVTDDEQVVIPVVTQEMYFIEITGADGAVNNYDLEIENFPAPVPTDVTLDPDDDSGMSNLDLVTFVDDARLFIKADLFDFEQMEIPILDAEAALEGTNPGAAVEVFVNGASVGFASPFGGLSTLWEFTLDVTADADPDVGQWSQAIPISTGRGTPNARIVASDNAGFFNIVQAAVRIFDGQNGGEAAGATGRSQLSEELDVHFDPNAPDAALATIDMLDASDSNVAGDLITSKMQPAFAGVAEANTKVRIFAERVVAGVPTGVVELIGEGVVGSDSSDGVLGDGLGQWEVTVEPLRDDVYDITAEFEDLAGNVSERTDGLRIEVDSRLPQRPTVDLVGMDVQDSQANVADLPGIVLVAPVFSDTGMDTMDDVTRGANPLNPGGQGTTDVQLRISAEPNANVVVKDGETVIATFVMPLPPNDFVFLTVTLDEDPHPISVEVFDAAGNRSHQSEELLVTVDVTPPPTPAAPDMIAASDTGMDQTDNVTSKMSPAFDGRAEKNDKIRIFADRVINGVPQNTPVLVGQGVVNSDETDGSPPANPLNNLGTWEITIEPMGDGVYDMTVELEDLAGNLSSRSEGLRIEIDAQQPNTPFLDLVEMDDTGRHNDDNITNITLVRNPTFRMTTDDHTADPTLPPDHLIAENFKYRIFDRAETGAVGNQQLQPEVLLFDSFTSSGGLFTSATLLTQQLSQVLNMPGGLALADGIHNLKLEVEDRAGNISEDFLLDVLIDTEAFLGQPEFDPDSDSGIWGFPATMEDNITSDKTPSFFGTAEADNIVTITIDGIPAGTAVAIPLDGDDAFRPPNDPYDLVEGNWLIETNLNLLDGEHAAVLTFEDPAGNRVSADPILFFVDTQGPRITNVTHGDVSTDGVFTLDEDTTSVFQPKPDGGPDPLISSIVIHFSDLPLRTANFPYEALFRALAEEEGNYSLIGDANGHIPILDVDVSFDTPIDGISPATARVELIFHDPAGGLFNGAGAPLPDDRFTLFVSDTIADPVGNPLDGESGAAAPFDGNDVPLATPPIFPTGDGEHGGDFVGRFTVDSRPEIGVWAGRSVYIDTNGNFFYDPENPDDTNEDINYTLGILSDNVFAGNFAETGNIADGFDKLAAYGRFNGAWRFLVDTDNDGVPEDLDGDGVPGVVNPLGINGLPVAGNFDGNAANGDEVGIFTGGVFWLDTGHTFQATTQFASNLIGYPIVGDFDGDGFDDLATWHDDTFDHFSIDLANGVANGWDGIADHTIYLGFAGERERPVAADMDGDGFDDLGLWVADRSGAPPKEAAEWYFLVSHGDSVLDRIENDDRGLPTVPFTPEPFGFDLFALFGDDDALPIVGNFDPPVVVGENISSQPYYTYDLNGDGAVSPLDALLVISALPNQGVNSSPAPQGADSLRYDVDGDGVVSPLDALLVIGQLGQADVPDAGEIAAGPLPHRELGQDVSDAATTAVFAADSLRVGVEDGFDNLSVRMDVVRPVGAHPVAQSQPGRDSKTVDRVFAALAAELSWQGDRGAPAYGRTTQARSHAEGIAGSVPHPELATRVGLDLNEEDLVDAVSRTFL